MNYDIDAALLGKIKMLKQENKDLKERLFYFKAVIEMLKAENLILKTNVKMLKCLENNRKEIP